MKAAALPYSFIPSFDKDVVLKNLPESPGVYRMLDDKQQILYVGKARNLRKRVSSYFQPRKASSSKQTLLMQQVVALDFTITPTENDALLLECQLIKQIKPKYNVLLRDDKSYPYIYLSTENDYPRLDFYRGIKSGKGRYYGPFTSTLSVRSTLNILQKVFKLRQCRDTFFQNRTRPCLQYQIKRCTAPCVNLISKEKYQQDVRHTQMFLDGKSDEVIKELIAQMDGKSKLLAYEDAAKYRDQITQLREIQQHQVINANAGDIDLFALSAKHGTTVIHLLPIRQGQMQAGRNYFPQVSIANDAQETLSAFLGQFYLTSRQSHAIPTEIIVSEKLADQTWLSEVLSQKAKRKVMVKYQVRDTRSTWINMASRNAEQAVINQLSNKSMIYDRLQDLQEKLQLTHTPDRIECFDISHTMGEATVASCVVFDAYGPVKKAYRRFNIKTTDKGDDYAAMREAIYRRYLKLKTEEKSLPDLLLIDGGKGQLSQAEQVLEELQIQDVQIIGIAKGVSRKPGLEVLHIAWQHKAINLPADSPALHLLQYIRDEAHRFAITGHRKQRDNKRQRSILETIPGIGNKRRQELLKHFGGLQALKKASITDIAKVSGISKTLAQQIYDTLQKR